MEGGGRREERGEEIGEGRGDTRDISIRKDEGGGRREERKVMKYE